MSPLYLKDGKLLLVGNALAGSANCCCVGACCKSDGYTDTCIDGLTQSDCESQGGTYHPGQTCAEEPCNDGCFERPLLGDEAYVDSWCANAASSVGFAGSPCELTTATCGARTLVNEYSPGVGNWIVTVCCDNPLP